MSVRRVWFTRLVLLGVCLGPGGTALSAQDTSAVSAVYSAADASHPGGRLEVFVGRAGGDKAGIFHAWETTQGPWQQPWIRYTPAPDNLPSGLVSGRDSAGRIMVAWIANQDILVLSADFAGASLHTPANRFEAEKPPADRPKFRYLTLATNANGLLEILALDTGGHAWSIKQLPGTGAWAWALPTQVGAHDLKTLSATRVGDGRLTMVATGGDGAVYMSTQDGPNGNWTKSWPPLEGHDIVEAHAQESLDHRLEVVALGADHRLYNRYEPFASHPWALLRQSPLEAPLYFGREADGTLLVVAHNTDGPLGNLRQTSPNGSWPTGGSFTNRFGSKPDGGHEVMVVDLNGRHAVAGVRAGHDRQIDLVLQQGANDLAWASGGALPELP